MNYYVDVKISPIAGAVAPAIAMHIIRAVHHHLANHECKIAVGLPDMMSGRIRRIGDRVRLFAEESETLDAVADMLEANKAIQDHIVVKRIKTCPTSSDKWVAYTRFRFPRRERTRQRSDMAERLLQVPVIFARSEGDTSHRFGLGIQAIEKPENESRNAESGRLNGYGLSTRASPYWLPVIP